MLMLAVKKQEKLVIEGSGKVVLFIKSTEHGLKYCIEAPREISITRLKCSDIIHYEKGGNK
jgi:sRNA-binding carbon storage regulator CsrA